MCSSYKVSWAGIKLSGGRNLLAQIYLQARTVVSEAEKSTLYQQSGTRPRSFGPPGPALAMSLQRLQRCAADCKLRSITSNHRTMASTTLMVARDDKYDIHSADALQICRCNPSSTGVQLTVCMHLPLQGNMTPISRNSSRLCPALPAKGGCRSLRSASPSFIRYRHECFMYTPLTARRANVGCYRARRGIVSHFTLMS
ncbi:hypothetical protein FKP32DRAFT_1155864 [Trametes sanguinea]|nr:hypothetical protein FKP32DRAFT_1155864 [Trametes sanguinea]